jgi:hypothetical protein
MQRSLDILLILRQLLRDSLILINRGLFGLVAESIIEAVAADSQKPILFGDCHNAILSVVEASTVAAPRPASNELFLSATRGR